MGVCSECSGSASSVVLWMLVVVVMQQSMVLLRFAYITVVFFIAFPGKVLAIQTGKALTAFLEELSSLF